jgi:cell division septation protein DedD
VFRNRVYAEELVRQLREKGYSVTLTEGSLLRVLVGPATSRADAERLVAKLRASGFEAIVTSTP